MAIIQIEINETVCILNLKQKSKKKVLQQWIMTVLLKQRKKMKSQFAYETVKKFKCKIMMQRIILRPMWLPSNFA